MFSKLDKNEVRRKKYQVRKDKLNKAQRKKYTEKKHQASNLNNKIFKSETNNCNNIKKPHIDLSSDKNAVD